MSSDNHICTPESYPQGANYYVTAIDGGKVYFMAGPYTTHAEALGMVERARLVACERDPSGRGDFMAWGTAKSTRSNKAPLTLRGLL